MSVRPTRSYRFATRDQWSTCRFQGFEPGADGGLVPTARLGASAVHEQHGGPLSAVAAGRHGRVLWRSERRGAAGVFQREYAGATRGPLELDHAVAASPRWVVDTEALWVFEPNAASVCRYDAHRLELVLAAAAGADVAILDAASDGRRGVWLLVSDRAQGRRTCHVDARGCAGLLTHVPCAAASADQIACLDRGRELVFLADRGRRLVFVAADSGTVDRIIVVADLVPGWSVERLTGDGRGRLALWGPQCAHAPLRHALMVLAPTGDVIDGPLFDPLPANVGVHDLAIADDVVWFATARGLFRLDSSEACVAREQDSVLLTPALVSEPDGDARGWLRAEVATDLPAGAELIVEYAGTNDASLAERIGNSGTRNDEHQLASLWETIALAGNDAAASPGANTGASYTFDGPLNGPLSIPLFDSPHQWIWLRLRLLVPPATSPPRLRELRVVYPDESIARYLPRVFQGADGDPAGRLRSLTGVIEGTTQDVDARIRMLGSVVDPAVAPESWLDTLAEWLDLPWDRGLPVAAKRALVSRAGDLIADRGTREGLRTLLLCLLGEKPSFSVTDLAVDRPVIWVGGEAYAGSRLPGVLAGAAPCAPILGAKTVLGRARLGADPDPLRSLAARLLIQIRAGRVVRESMSSKLERLLADFVPAGIAMRIRWSTGDSSSATADTLLILDAPRASVIGRDRAIGSTVLAGRPRRPMTDEGFESDFLLH